MQRFLSACLEPSQCSRGVNGRVEALILIFHCSEVCPITCRVFAIDQAERGGWTTTWMYSRI